MQYANSYVASRTFVGMDLMLQCKMKSAPEGARYGFNREGLTIYDAGTTKESTVRKTSARPQPMVVGTDQTRI